MLSLFLRGDGIWKDVTAATSRKKVIVIAETAATNFPIQIHSYANVVLKSG